MNEELLDEVKAERDRQDAKWGWPKEIAHRNDDWKLLTLAGELETAAREVNDVGGKATWASILAEEVGEAINAPSAERRREELIQVAAVALSEVQDIDERLRGA